MRRISSKLTFCYKRIFPAIWFGLLAIFLIIGLGSMKARQAPWPLLIVPIVMAVFGFFIMKKLVFGLADEVWETDDHLVVKNKGAEERILFSDIKHVNCSIMTNPPRITLTLRMPSRFGSEIIFSPLTRFGFLSNFSIHPIATELIDKVDRARQS
jgi:hypothetical protein